MGSRYRFRKRNAGGFRRARTFVRRTVATMGPIEAKRVILDAISIPDISAAAYDNAVDIPLLIAQESVDEEVESNGTTIAEVRPYSKLVGMKLNLLCRGTVNDPLTIRWMLTKWEDGEELSTTLVDSLFHSSNDTPTARELRARTLAKGIFMTNNSSGISKLNVFVRRMTLKRLGNLRENDRIVLTLAANAAATTQATISGFGTLYCRLN